MALASRAATVGVGMVQHANRETVDIEALLVRAYREKRVDRYGQDGRQAGAVALGLGSGPRAPGSQLGGPERVDTSSYAANSAARAREAFLRLTNTADGLLALHDAVLTLPDMFVQYGAGDDFAVFTADEAARIGHRVTLAGDRATIQAVRRRGGRSADRDDLIPDGDPRPCTRIVTSVLVIGHGRDMSRPDLSEVIKTERPIYADRHRNIAGYDVTYEPSLDVVAFERAVYAAWHAALGRLVEARAACAEFAITGPHALAAPWIDAETSPVIKAKCLRKRRNSKAPPSEQRAA